MREIIFYRNQAGAGPVEDFLDSLSSKQAQRVAWVLRLIEEIELVPAQYFKKLDGTTDLWEVRVQIGGTAIRLLGFLHSARFLVLTNGFAKKTRKLPSQAIVLAEQRRRDYLDRGKKK